jgi:D-glycero-alpha-D-manno-heptose-7-phosphate kinase
LLITRTPLRISIGGGGTDLPSFYRNDGGYVLSAAIDKYIYIALNRTFSDDYFLKYSEIERVKFIDDIKHPILREAFRCHDLGRHIELVSIADVPSGTGLGSSGAFTVGVLKAMYAMKREHVTAAALAEEACRVEIDVLKNSVGKQDQYIAAFGGLTEFTFRKDDSVEVAPLAIAGNTLHELEQHLLLFFTGQHREASSMLLDQVTRSRDNDAEMISNLRETKALGYEIRNSLMTGDLNGYGELLNRHWMIKRQRSPEMTNSQIDNWYEIARKNGALGGKLVGAGGGGFLLFLVEEPQRLRTSMLNEGLEELRFAFDLDGSTVLTRG